MGSKCCACCYRCICRCCCRCCCRRCRRGMKDGQEEEEAICIYPPICRTAQEINQLASCRLADFERQEKIGHGRFGNVYKVVERHSQKTLAIKEVQIYHEMYHLEPEMLEEYHVLAKLKSEWLMEILQCYETATKLCLVLEYLPGPSLLRLAKSGPPLTPRLRVTYAAEMALALQSLHHHGFMHRDLKLSNFLLDPHGHVKLCDFGSCIRFLPRQLARQVFPLKNELNKYWDLNMFDLRRSFLRLQQFKPTIPHGTSYYCAPEVIRLATRKPPLCASYTFLCDYWSLGVCYYYLFFRHLPFYCDEKVRLPSLIFNWRKTLKFPKWQRKKVGENCVSLIQGLLRAEKDRLGNNGLHDLVIHPFFANVNWNPVPTFNLTSLVTAPPSPRQPSSYTSDPSSRAECADAATTIMERITERGSRMALPSKRTRMMSLSSGGSNTTLQKPAQATTSTSEISTPLLTKYNLRPDKWSTVTNTNVSAAVATAAAAAPAPTTLSESSATTCVPAGEGKEGLGTDAGGR